MRGLDWNETAIFPTWDDWGGFYDHALPPVVDRNGYGSGSPVFLISPWARAGFIDLQTLSFDAYLKFIEDLFLSKERLNPRTLSRPDSRPTVRERVSILGDSSASSTSPRTRSRRSSRIPGRNRGRSLPPGGAHLKGPGPVQLASNDRTGPTVARLTLDQLVQVRILAAQLSSFGR